MSRRKSRFPALVKDANGKNLCRGCHGTVPPKRKTWCSLDCKKKHDPWHVKEAAWERDKGRCQMCDVNLRVGPYERYRAKVEYDHIIPFSEGGLTSLENIQCVPAVPSRKNGSVAKVQAEKARANGVVHMSLSIPDQEKIARVIKNAVTDYLGFEIVRKP